MLKIICGNQALEELGGTIRLRNGPCSRTQGFFLVLPYALELSVMLDLPEGFTMVLNLKGGGGDV